MDSAFTVTPMNKTIELKPGEVYEGEIKVANPEKSKSDFSFKVEVTPYGVSGNNYEADIVTQTSSTMISEWITVENPTGVVEPNGVATVKYTIKVPSDAPGGGQYASLTVSSNDETAQENYVNSVFSVASLIFAEIDGEIKHEGSVLENKIPGFVLSIPFKTTMMMNNSGNTHEIASIYLEVSNYFTGEIIYPKTGDTGGFDEPIMPSTTRYMEREVKDISPVGIYKVRQTINYLGNTNTTETVVVACPIWFMFIVFVVICSIIAGIIKLIQHRIHKKTAL